MKPNLQHILGISDFRQKDLDYIISVADTIARNPKRYAEVAKGKILATLFFEPSTRTRLSFESAMLRLGGNVIGFSDMSTTSASKGETLEDTARTVSCYSDLMAVRHPVPLSPHKMAAAAGVPVINAGDGANEHPTQTLTDLVTIYRRFGRVDHLTIGLCGDLKYGRTVHSLIRMLSRYPGNRFVLISPPELPMPTEIVEELTAQGMDITENSNLTAALPELDILYMTRIQRERFSDPEQYQRLKGCYILDSEKMEHAKADMIVLHPLPRVDEITEDVDNDPRAWYFKQAQMGVFARMALIIKLLELNDLMTEDYIYVHPYQEYKSGRLQQGA
ncbi:aspartate carbamoyltransferase [Oscillospiraceae bacterium MB08-C2-2]|nr:aspartate carbamoyltransferase [Oscillospiraceae bacterium MB08-C2-2]